jgi:hypothetical protein
MSDYEFPEAPEVEKACRAAHRALEGVVSPGSFVPEGDLSITEVISQFRSMVEKAEMAVAAQLGPLVSWEAPRWEGDWELVMTGADLDNGAYDFGSVALSGDAFEGPDGGWRGSTLDRAALVPARRCACCGRRARRPQQPSHGHLAQRAWTRAAPP